MRVFFRADGNSTIGLGHVMRCVAIAEMIENAFKCTFIIRQPESYLQQELKKYGDLISIPQSDDYDANKEVKPYISRDCIVVLDGYHFDEKYQQQVIDAGGKLLCVDDVATYPFVAHAIINHGNESGKVHYKAPDYTRLFFGFSFAILRATFLEQAKLKRSINAINTAFVNMGGADEHNISLKASKALLNIGEIKKINLVLGGANLHEDSLGKLQAQHADKINIYRNLSAETLCKVMAESDVAICPASSISIELCCVGIGLLTGTTTDNQLTIYDGLITSNIAEGIGNFINISEESLTEKINEFCNKPRHINQMIKNQKQIFDGNSGNRILAIFKALQV